MRVHGVLREWGSVTCAVCVPASLSWCGVVWCGGVISWSMRGCVLMYCGVVWCGLSVRWFVRGVETEHFFFSDHELVSLKSQVDTTHLCKTHHIDYICINIHCRWPWSVSPLRPQGAVRVRLVIASCVPVVVVV